MTLYGSNQIRALLDELAFVKNENLKAQAQLAKAVDDAALPERRPGTNGTNGTWGDMGDAYNAGWNDCLDQVAEMRATLATQTAAGEPVYQVMYLGLDGGGWVDVDRETMERNATDPKHFLTRTLWASKEEK